MRSTKYAQMTKLHIWITILFFLNTLSDDDSDDQSPSGILEVAVVERPMWDVELPGYIRRRYHALHQVCSNDKITYLNHHSIFFLQKALCIVPLNTLSDDDSDDQSPSGILEVAVVERPMWDVGT
jgi:hypothetical protein